MDTPNAVPSQVLEPSKKEKKKSWLVYFLVFLVILLVAGLSAAVTYIVIKDSDNDATVTQEDSEDEDTTTSADQETTNPNTDDEETASDERALRVYFQKFPEATDDYSFVDAVFRTTTRTDDTIFVLEEFLKGPTVVEEAEGFKGIEPVSLSGPSSCNGKNFELTISDNIATFQFCKATSGLNDNTSQVSVPISENVKYYNPEVEKVIILDIDGNCFNDLSGINACLN